MLRESRRPDPYADFEQKARSLTNIQRDTLIRKYSEAQKNAETSKNYDEAGYYLKLQEILNRLNRETPRK